MFFAALAQFTILLAAVQYLLGQADMPLLAAVRDRLPAVLQQLLRCPSCCGFWLGLLAGYFGLAPVWGDGLPILAFGEAVDVVASRGFQTGISGVAAIALTPFARGVMDLGFAVAYPPQHDPNHVHEGAPGALSRNGVEAEPRSSVGTVDEG